MTPEERIAKAQAGELATLRLTVNSLTNALRRVLENSAPHMERDEIDRMIAACSYIDAPVTLTASEDRIAKAPRAFVIKRADYIVRKLFIGRENAEFLNQNSDYPGKVVPVAIVELKEGE